MLQGFRPSWSPKFQTRAAGPSGGPGGGPGCQLGGPCQAARTSDSEGCFSENRLVRAHLASRPARAGQSSET